MSASLPQGQESGLISACHKTCLSLHTHSGREVHFSSEKKPVNLTQLDVRCAFSVFTIAAESPPSIVNAAVQEEVLPLMVQICLIWT